MTPLVERVRTRLAEEGREPTSAAVADAIRAESGGVASDLDVLAALRVLREELVGAGPLDPLLRQPGTTDVLVSTGGTVFVDRGAGLEPAGVRLPDEAAVRRLAQRLALAAGRRLDDASPYVDGWLSGGPGAAHGIRLHAVLPPVAADGTCLSLRVLRPAAHDLASLARLGTLDRTAETLLRAIVAARLAVLVSGGTGSGKTTVLGALLGAVDPAERILTVEDAQELQPRHPQVVRLVARPANIEGAGGISLRDLVRQALRMRPDRLVVGEVRGSEVCDLLAALNTGHDGGAGTVHANSAREVPARMEALAALGGMSRPALHSQLAAAVQVVLHMRRLPRGRVLDAVAVLTREANEVAVRPVWERGRGWTPDRVRLAALLVERGVTPPWDRGGDVEVARSGRQAPPGRRRPDPGTAGAVTSRPVGPEGAASTDAVLGLSNPVGAEGPAGMAPSRAVGPPPSGAAGASLAQRVPGPGEPGVGTRRARQAVRRVSGGPTGRPVAQAGEQ